MDMVDMVVEVVGCWWFFYSLFFFFFSKYCQLE